MDPIAAFSHKDVSWIVDEIPVEGTLLTPESGSMHPGVVMVAGSGPTDRDWCSPLLPGTNGSGKLLGEILSKNGFTTIRYDKRASGPNIRKYISRLIGKIDMRGHLEELSGAVSTLIENGHTLNNRVYALTNSEGGIHALNYQLEGEGQKFRGFVLTGFPGRSIGQVARQQLLTQLGGTERSDELIRLYDEAVDDFLSGKPVTNTDKLPDVMKQLLASLTNPANLPFSRENLCRDLH